MGIEDVEDFATALHLEEKRRQGRCLPDPTVPPDAYFYRESVHYSAQVRRYLDVFGKERVHIIIYDDLKRDTPGVYKQTLHFLEVCPDFQPHLEIVNPNKRLRSKSLRNLLLRPPAIVQRIARAVLPASFREGLGRSLWHLNTAFAPRRTMDVDLRNQLREELQPEVRELSVLLGRDLSHWSQTTQLSGHLRPRL